MVQRPPNRGPIRVGPEEEDHGLLPQRAHRRASRKRRNHTGHETKVLVAWYEPMDRRLRQRMRSLPTKQKLDAPNTPPYIPYRPRPPGKPIRRDSDGSHHATPKERSIRRHTHDSRPRMHKSGHLPPLLDHHYGRRHRQPLSEQRLSVVRTPQEDDIRPRPKVYLSLRPSPDATTGSETEHINSLPPTDGRTVRKEESMGGAVPSLRNNRSTGRLERVVSNRLPRAQHSNQRHHQDGPNPGPPRVSP
jgi:hypothetical protein